MGSDKENAVQEKGRLKKIDVVGTARVRRIKRRD